MDKAKEVFRRMKVKHKTYEVYEKRKEFDMENMGEMLKKVKRKVCGNQKRKVLMEKMLVLW